MAELITKREFVLVRTFTESGQMYADSKNLGVFRLRNTELKRFQNENNLVILDDVTDSHNLENKLTRSKIP